MRRRERATTLVVTNTTARAAKSHGRRGCELCTRVGCAFGSLPVPGRPGTALTCAGTNVIFGLTLNKPTVKILVTVLALSVAAIGRVVLALMAWTSMPI